MFNSGNAKTSAGIHLIHCLARESGVGMSKENDAEACSLKFPVLNTSPQRLFYSVVITDQDNNSSLIQTRKNIKQ